MLDSIPLQVYIINIDKKEVILLWPKTYSKSIIITRNFVTHPPTQNTKTPVFENLEDKRNYVYFNIILYNKYDKLLNDIVSVKAP